MPKIIFVFSFVALLFFGTVAHAANLLVKVQNNHQVDVGKLESRLIYDPTNDREVVGAFQDIFTGKGM